MYIANHPKAGYPGLAGVPKAHRIDAAIVRLDNQLEGGVFGRT
jgi:hypothetical protein